MPRSAVSAPASFLFCSLAANIAAAQIVLEAHFDPPAFNTGNIVGQQGWATEDGGAAGTVVAGQSVSSPNALRINSAGFSFPAWWYKPLNLDASGQIVNVSWSMYIDPPSFDARSSYGIDIYSSSSPNLTRILNVWSEANFNGELFHNALPTDILIPVRQWHDYRARLNFASWSYIVFYDGQQVASGNLDPSAGSTIGDVDIWAGNPNADIAYFDDLIVRLGDPPAPACPADVDNDGDPNNGGTPDGAVTIEDLLFYLAAFELGLPAADLDDDGDPTNGGTPDGAVTIEDLLFFLARFEGGC